MGLLDSLSQQCHEHLRDADRKRDELIGFYAIIVGLLFAAYDKIDDSMRALIALVIGLVGLFVALAVIQYRKWHTIYSNCFRTLDDLKRRFTDPTSSDVEAAWRDLGNPTGYWSKWKLLNPFAGTEAATFGGFVVLSYLPWYLLIRTNSWLPSFHVSSDAIAFPLNLVLYVLAIAVVATVTFYRADKQSPFEHWVLRPFRPQTTTGHLTDSHKPK